MNITQVHYQKLASLGNYENERIGAWATVEEGQTPDESLATLIAWVEEQGQQRTGQEEEVARGQVAIQRLESVRHTLEREITEMRETWRKARAFLQTVGLELPRSYVSEADDSDMPF